MQQARFKFAVPIAGRTLADFHDMVVDEDAVYDSIRLPAAFSDAQRGRIIFDIRNAVDETVNALAPTPALLRAVAVHTHGAPGAGKSTMIARVLEEFPLAERERWGVASHDRMLEAITEWREQLAALNALGGSAEEKHEALLAVRAQFMDAARVGSDMTINKFILNHISFIRDSKSSDRTAITIPETLTGHGFENRYISVFAPYAVCKERAMSRERPVSLEHEVIGSRIGAYRFLPQILESVAVNEEDFLAVYNHEVDAPVTIFKIEGGRLTERNMDMLNVMAADMRCDLTHPDLKSNFDMHVVTETTLETLHAIRNAPIGAPTGLAQYLPHGSPASQGDQPPAHYRPIQEVRIQGP